MHALGPTADFNAVKLKTRRLAPGRVFQRIVRAKFPDPLGYGLNPTRFSDPKQLNPSKEFGVVYLGASLEVCFLEAVLRDQRNGQLGDYLMDMSEFESRNLANIGVEKPLVMADLTGGKKIEMGIPSDVTNASDQHLGREWAEAIYLHPMKVDGLIYESRLNKKMNLAVFDRAIAKLTPLTTTPLINAVELPRIIRKYKVAIAPDLE